MNIEGIRAILKQIDDPIENYDNDAEIAMEIQAIYKAFNTQLGALVSMGLTPVEIARGFALRLRAAAEARKDIDFSPLFAMASNFGRQNRVYMFGLALKHKADWVQEVQDFWFPEEEESETRRRSKKSKKLSPIHVHEDRTLKGRRLLVIGDVRNNSNRLELRFGADSVEIINGHDKNSVQRAMGKAQDIVVVQVRYSSHVFSGSSAGDYRLWANARVVIPDYSPGSGGQAIARAITDNTSESGFEK